MRRRSRGWVRRWRTSTSAREMTLSHSDGSLFASTILTHGT